MEFDSIIFNFKKITENAFLHKSRDACIMACRQEKKKKKKKKENCGTKWKVAATVLIKWLNEWFCKEVFFLLFFQCSGSSLTFAWAWMGRIRLHQLMSWVHVTVHMNSKIFVDLELQCTPSTPAWVVCTSVFSFLNCYLYNVYTVFYKMFLTQQSRDRHCADLINFDYNVLNYCTSKRFRFRIWSFLRFQAQRADQGAFVQLSTSFRLDAVALVQPRCKWVLECR